MLCCDCNKTFYKIKLNFAGETSAGKSTLINKILEKKIFKGRHLESTSTICKIRNSERVQITTEKADGRTEVEDLTDKCNPETSEGEKLLRTTLTKFVDMNSSKESTSYRSVEVEFPITILKVY